MNVISRNHAELEPLSPGTLTVLAALTSHCSQMWLSWDWIKYLRFTRGFQQQQIFSKAQLANDTSLDLYWNLLTLFGRDTPDIIKSWTAFTAGSINKNSALVINDVTEPGQPAPPRTGLDCWYLTSFFIHYLSKPLGFCTNINLLTEGLLFSLFT